MGMKPIGVVVQDSERERAYHPPPPEHKNPTTSSINPKPSTLNHSLTQACARTTAVVRVAGKKHRNPNAPLDSRV